MTGASSPYGPLLVPVAELFTGFARSFWVRGIPVEPHAPTPTSCLVVGAEQVRAYHLTGSEGWAHYDTIRTAFEARNRKRQEGGAGAKTSPLPRELVTTGVRILLRDRDDPIECLVSTDPIYPRRAWVGVLHPGVGAETPYVLAGMLNSTLGLVLYHRLAHPRGGNGAARGHDLRKGVLGRLKLPFLSYDVEAFQRAALLSYRLHCLYAASREPELPPWVVDEEIPNHRMSLLSELVRLYGFDDREARELVEAVLPAGAADVPGAQQKLFYRPREPLAPIRLQTPEMLDRYEDLKAHARRGTLDVPGRTELDRLQALLTWEHRANSPIPTLPEPKRPEGAFTPEAAMRLADRYLSATRGQSVLSRSAQRINSRLWEVQLQYAAPPRAAREGEAGLTAEQRNRAHPGRLWVNALTGAVSEEPGQARDAAASGA